MSIAHEFRKLLWKVGYDVFRFDPISHPLARKRKLLELYDINVVLDVGANTGQFARQMRSDIGFTGKIVSFEPLSSAFEVLKRTASGDTRWVVQNYALGDTDAAGEIHIAANSYSSSLLNMLPSHIRAAPESHYVGSEAIEVKTLDSIFNATCSSNDNVYLKIDTQGFESRVIKGAEHSLAFIDTIQLEMSLVPLYQNELLFSDMCNLLGRKGYSLVSIETGFSNQQSGQLLQVDGVFHRLSS